MVEQLVEDLDSGTVAIGFEGPLWVPVRRFAVDAGRARIGEPIAWSSNVGASVLASALGLVAWLVGRVADHCRDIRITLDPLLLRTGEADPLIWEAMVTTRSGGDTGLRRELQPLAPAGTSHVDDATRAAVAFLSTWRGTHGTEPPIELGETDRGVVNLASASVRSAGLPIIGVEHAPCETVAISKRMDSGPA